MEYMNAFPFDKDPNDEFLDFLYQDHVGDWALKRIGTLQSRLERLRLPGPGVVVALANEVFGYNGWSSQVVDCVATEETYLLEVYTTSYACVVKVILQDGTEGEGHGVGSAKSKSKPMSYSRAKRQAVARAVLAALTELPVKVMRGEH